VSAGDAVPGIEVALEKPASRFEFNETPLRDVIAKIREAHGIPVELDQKALADAGFDLDTPITQCLSGISLRSALRLLLDNIGLTYLVKNEVLLITTREADVEHPTVRLYPLRRRGTARAVTDQSGQLASAARRYSSYRNRRKSTRKSRACFAGFTCTPLRNLATRRAHGLQLPFPGCTA
jgi:hypothetical protein